MKMLNALEAVPADAAGRAALLREGLSILIRVLYPVVPHIGCALWDELGFADELRPAARRAVAAGRSGRARAGRDRARAAGQRQAPRQAHGPAGCGQAAIEAAARASAEVAKHAAGAPIKRVIIVPGKLVNVVV